MKDLETGLKKSTSYISESHRAWEGPEGRQEWREVRRAGDQGDYSLEQQVQHMIGGEEGEGGVTVMVYTLHITHLTQVWRWTDTATA